MYALYSCLEYVHYTVKHTGTLHVGYMYTLLHGGNAADCLRALVPLKCSSKQFNFLKESQDALNQGENALVSVPFQKRSTHRPGH